MQHADDRDRLRHVRKPVVLPSNAAGALCAIALVILVLAGVLAGLLAGSASRHGVTTTVTVSTR